MAVKLGSTWAEIIKAINEGKGGRGIPKLTTQTVAIADLEAGVYLWDYNGEKTLDFGSGTKNVVCNGVFLQIVVDNGQKYFLLFDDNSGAPESLEQKIIYGGLYIYEDDSTEGYCAERYLSDMPIRDEDGINFISNGRLYVASDNDNIDFFAYVSITFSVEMGDIIFQSPVYYEAAVFFEYDVNFDGEVVFSTAPKVGSSNVATEEFVTTKIDEILEAIENGSY